MHFKATYECHHVSIAFSEDILRRKMNRNDGTYLVLLKDKAIGIE